MSDQLNDPFAVLGLRTQKAAFQGDFLGIAKSVGHAAVLMHSPCQGENPQIVERGGPGAAARFAAGKFVPDEGQGVPGAPPEILLSAENPAQQGTCLAVA